LGVFFDVKKEIRKGQTLSVRTVLWTVRCPGACRRAQKRVEGISPSAPKETPIFLGVFFDVKKEIRKGQTLSIHMFHGSVKTERYFIHRKTQKS